MNCNNAIKQRQNDALIQIHVIPNSSKSIFPAGYNNWRSCIDIRVISATKDNKANNEIIEKISKYFNILPKNVSIISGLKGRVKTILIKNIEKNDIIKKIEDSLNGL